MRTPSEAFGQLRALLQRRVLTERQRRNLWLLMERAAERWPEDYEEQWVEYLRSFPRHLAQPLHTIERVAELDVLASRHPVGVFSLKLETRLTRRDGLSAREVDEITSSPHLTRIVALELYDSGLGDAGVASLLSSPHLTRLKTLDVGLSNISDDGAGALAGSQSLAGVEVLDLRTNDIGNEGARNLATSSHLSALKVLRLGGQCHR